MGTYTGQMQTLLDSISMEDENFGEELLQVARSFRSFAEGLDEFIRKQGYAGEPKDVNAKVAFIRQAFEQAGMKPPREIREWFAGQTVKRDTAFQICFAFGLDGYETDEFFRRIFARERSFDCHQTREAIYYFCLNNGLTWADAEDIQDQLPPAGERRSGEAVHTGSIISELNSLTTREELIACLTENIDQFNGRNVTACETIRRLWEQATGLDGLLTREQEQLPSLHDDAASGEKSGIGAGKAGLSLWAACLAIFQLKTDDVNRLSADRSLKPILRKLSAEAQDSFPDRQGINKILLGKQVSYETVRKWLVLLTFYTFWAKKALREGGYAADPEDAKRWLAGTNQYLTEAGYPELYVGNPYDWIFFYASGSDEPLYVFRYIWNELLTAELEEHR